MRVRVREARVFFWPEGTHFFPPGVLRGPSFLAALRRLRRPPAHPHVTLVGEAFGPYQGWTEGALRSVEAELDRVAK